MSPDDPGIKAAAEAAALKILENEKEMEDKKKESEPKTLDEEVSGMVTKSLSKPEDTKAQAAAATASAAKVKEVEKAKAQILAATQSKEDREFTPIKRTPMDAILHPSVSLSED